MVTISYFRNVATDSHLLEDPSVTGGVDVEQDCGDAPTVAAVALLVVGGGGPTSKNSM